jgi:hypothetical protein
MLIWQDFVSSFVGDHHLPQAVCQQILSIESHGLPILRKVVKLLQSFCWEYFFDICIFLGLFVLVVSLWSREAGVALEDGKGVSHRDKVRKVT